jgi:hypothetical protein
MTRWSTIDGNWEEIADEAAMLRNYFAVMCGQQRTPMVDDSARFVTGTNRWGLDTRDRDPSIPNCCEHLNKIDPKRRRAGCFGTARQNNETLVLRAATAVCSARLPSWEELNARNHGNLGYRPPRRLPRATRHRDRYHRLKRTAASTSRDRVARASQVHVIR